MFLTGFFVHSRSALKARKCDGQYEEQGKQVACTQHKGLACVSDPCLWILDES